MAQNKWYALYLRKSRKDKDLEDSGIDTLERHRKILLDLAEKQGLSVGEVYKEVVSGDSIDSRPEMRRLLEDVHSHRWAGVLVVELERLARGDTKDQGIVAEAFKYSSTLIVTPGKTYDPNDEFDEEYFEFGLFMSRREYKTIKRRLTAGVKLSVLEGNFLGPVAPYGYDIVDKGRRDRTLTPNDKAKIIQLIFRWYAVERLSFTQIAQRLADMGEPSPKGSCWTASTVTKLIKNDIYIGKVRHGKWKEIKEYDPKTNTFRKVCREQPDSEIILADGKHPALIDPETWAAAMARRSKTPRVKKDAGLCNPLAGLIRCAQCGKMMHFKRTIRPNKIYQWFRHRPDSITGCVCHSSEYQDVMNSLASSLLDHITDFKFKLDSADRSGAELHHSLIEDMEKNLASLKARRKKVLISYEDGLYTDEEFLERKADINADIEALTVRLEEAYVAAPTKIDYQEKIIQFSEAVDAILQGADPKHINDFLKDILQEIQYSRPNKSDSFKLDLKLL